MCGLHVHVPKQNTLLGLCICSLEVIKINYVYCLSSVASFQCQWPGRQRGVASYPNSHVHASPLCNTECC